MIAISEEVFERNRHLLGPDEDYWIGQRVSRGVKDVPGDDPRLSPAGRHGGMLAAAIPPAGASLFKDGIKVMVPSHRRTPPENR